MGRGKFFQHVHCGRAGLCFAAPCRRLEIQLVEQNLRELRRRIDVEFFARQFPDFFLQAADLFLHRLRHGIERLRIHANARALHARKNRRERQINFFVHVGEALLFHLRAKDRREPVQRRRALPRRAGEHHAEMAHYYIGKIVVRCRRTQQIRIELRGVLDSLSVAGQKLEQLRIVDDFGAFRVREKRSQNLERLVPFVEPDRAPFVRRGGNLDRRNARAKPFRLALARVEIQPHGQRPLRGQLFNVLAEFGRARKLSVICFWGRFPAGASGCRHSGGTQFF